MTAIAQNLNSFAVSVYFKHHLETYLLFIYLADEEVKELQVVVKIYHGLILDRSLCIGICIINSFEL